MAVQARDRGHPAPGRVVRDMCVYKMTDENGKSLLVINAPDQNSRQVADVMNQIFSQRPEDLSNDFKRSATLVRLVIYMLTAASETKLTNEMREIGWNFNALYMRFRGELQGLMVCSFDMFELFKTACYYFDEGNVDLAKERLEEMKMKSTDGQKVFGNISQKMLQVEEDVQKLITRLTNRRCEIGEEAFEVSSVCLSECMSGLMNIASFLSEQTTFLTEMQHAFDFEQRCTKMRGDLNGKTFQELTDNVTPGGFMYEIHGTIVRCTAAKKVSKAYTEELKARRAVFTQMISTTPTKTMAQQEVADMMVDYNQEFPEYAFKARVLAKIKEIDWTQPPAPPPEQTTSEPSSWSDYYCVLM